MSFEDLLRAEITEAQLAKKIADGANSTKSDSWRYAELAKEILIGKGSLGNEIEITFHGTEEVDIKNWNTLMEEYLKKDNLYVNTLKQIIEMSGMLTDKEKELLLSINEEGLKDIAHELYINVNNQQKLLALEIDEPKKETEKK